MTKLCQKWRKGAIGHANRVKWIIGVLNFWFLNQHLLSNNVKNFIGCHIGRIWSRANRIWYNYTLQCKNPSLIWDSYIVDCKQAKTKLQSEKVCVKQWLGSNSKMSWKLLIIKYNREIIACLIIWRPEKFSYSLSTQLIVNRCNIYSELTWKRLFW